MSDRRKGLEIWLQELLEMFPLSPASGNINHRISAVFGCSHSELIQVLESPEMVVSSGISYGPYSQDSIILPSNWKALKKWSVYTLARACTERNIDCSTFRGRMQYVNALSPYCVPYLQDKDARKWMSQYKRNSWSPVLDNIFGDTCRRLGVPEKNIPLTQQNYSTSEKYEVIMRTISIWDSDIIFTPEDSLMTEVLLRGSELDSFFLLTLLYRISLSCSSNFWIGRFCSEGGVRGLSCCLTFLLERPTSLNCTYIRYLIRIIRLILSSSATSVVVSACELIELTVQCLFFEHRSLSIDILETLSEMIIFGGDSALWAIANGFRNVAHSRNESSFGVLFNSFPVVDIEVKCAILNFLNTLLVSCNDHSIRLSLRQEIINFEFHKQLNSQSDTVSVSRLEVPPHRVAEKAQTFDDSQLSFRAMKLLCMIPILQ